MASALASLLRRLAAVALVVLLCVGFISPAEAKGKAAKTISPEDMAVIRKQAEEFMEAKDRLPELATLVNERDWVFTRNLIRGPMQPLGREMLYINQLTRQAKSLCAYGTDCADCGYRQPILSLPLISSREIRGQPISRRARIL